MARRNPENHDRRMIPPDSEIPPVFPAPHLEEVLPEADEEAGGMNNVPEEMLAEDEQVEDELNHLGMEVELPGEDEATLEADQEHPKHREHRGEH